MSAYYPVFLDLTDGSVLVVGGGPVAEGKVEGLLAAGGLSGGNFLNNWLLATNLYPPDLALADIEAPLEELCRREPRLPVVVRSLTAPLHAALLADLSRPEIERLCNRRPSRAP